MQERLSVLPRQLGKAQRYACPSHWLVEGCGHTKVTNAKGTKKSGWHWDAVHQKAFDEVKLPWQKR